MAQKKIVPAKSKSTKPISKAPAVQVLAAKGPVAKVKAKSAASAAKPASTKKAPVSHNPVSQNKSASKSNASTASTSKKVVKVVKATATPVKAAAKPVQAAKVIEKKPVAQKAQSVAPAHTSSVSSVKPAVAQPAPKPAVAAAPKAHVAAPAAAVNAARPQAPQQQPARSVAAAVAKPLGQKISAPPVSAKEAADRAAAALAAAAALKKPVSQRHGFKKDEFVVYPAHGVGRIVAIEEQEIAGMSLELFVISFEKDKMTLRVPTGKLASVGMRKLAEEDVVRKAMETLKGRARVKRTMWSRRAQEYEAKINSGDLVSIAEVVRDLYRSEQQPEQSYSERQLYEAALDRMAREIAAVDRIDDRNAVQRITEVLSKSAKGRRLASEAADAAEAAEAEEIKAA